VDGYQSDKWKGAIANVATYWLTSAIGSHYGHGKMQFDPSREFQRATAHGMVQGGAYKLRGGSFRAGFASGFTGSFAGSLLGQTQMGQRIAGAHWTMEAAGTATVSGLSSWAAGGKFSDGFRSGLEISLWNHLGELFEAYRKKAADVRYGSTSAIQGGDPINPLSFSHTLEEESRFAAASGIYVGAVGVEKVAFLTQGLVAALSSVPFLAGGVLWGVESLGAGNALSQGGEALMATHSPREKLFGFGMFVLGGSAPAGSTIFGFSRSMYDDAAYRAGQYWNGEWSSQFRPTR
jgi:hypothetical protein